MPGYVSLLKYTNKGIGSIKDSPGRIAKAKQAAEQAGIRTIGVWVTMGEHDLVAIWDAPDDAAIATLILSLGAQGNVSTQTMRAFSEEEFAQIVGRLP